MNLFNKNPALILVDVQKGFLDTAYWGGNRNNPDAEAKCGQLLEKWRTEQLPIFHVRHSSTTPESRLNPSHDGFAFQDMVLPNDHEPVITKHVNSSFIGTDLQAQLKHANITTLVIAGLTTDHCVSTTTRMAGNFGFEVYLVADACATFDKIDINGSKIDAQTVHDVNLASLHDEFATVIKSSDL